MDGVFKNRFGSLVPSHAVLRKKEKRNPRHKSGIDSKGDKMKP